MSRITLNLKRQGAKNAESRPASMKRAETHMSFWGRYNYSVDAGSRISTIPLASETSLQSSHHSLEVIPEVTEDEEPEADNRHNRRSVRFSGMVTVVDFEARDKDAPGLRRDSGRGLTLFRSASHDGVLSMLRSNV